MQPRYFKFCWFTDTWPRKKFTKEWSTKLLWRNFLLNKVVNNWNRLSQDKVNNSPPINVFKNRLDREMENWTLNLVHYSVNHLNQDIVKSPPINTFKKRLGPEMENWILCIILCDFLAKNYNFLQQNKTNKQQFHRLLLLLYLIIIIILYLYDNVYAIDITHTCSSINLRYYTLLYNKTILCRHL